MVTLKEISALIDQGIASLPVSAKPEGLYGPIRYTMESGGKPGADGADHHWLAVQPSHALDPFARALEGNLARIF